MPEQMMLPTKYFLQNKVIIDIIILLKQKQLKPTDRLFYLWVFIALFYFEYISINQALPHDGRAIFMPKEDKIMAKVIAIFDVDIERLKETENRSSEDAFSWCMESAFSWCNDSGVVMESCKCVGEESSLTEMFVLLESVEGSDGIRDCSVKAIGFSEEPVQAELKSLVEQDPYGLIETNGIRVDLDSYFESNFTDRGFVKYEIVRQKVSFEKEEVAK